MAHPFVLLLFANLAVSAAPGMPSRPVFSYASETLSVALTRIGGSPARPADTAPPAGPEAGAWRVACDSSAGAFPGGPGAWFEIELTDPRAGRALRFPVDEASLRRGLRKACAEGGEEASARIAAGLRALAARLRVRVEDPHADPGGPGLRAGGGASDAAGAGE